MTISEMTIRSYMVEVKVRSIFSGKMLSPGRPISRIGQLGFWTALFIPRNNPIRLASRPFATFVVAFRELYTQQTSGFCSRCFLRSRRREKGYAVELTRIIHDNKDCLLIGFTNA
jgi:hypothetical protein